MQGGHRGNTGARRSHPGRVSSAPYSHPIPEERHERPYNTRSGSTPQNPARSDVLVSQNPPTQSTSQPLPSNNLPANAAAQRPSARLISQTPYVSSRARGVFVAADPISFSVNGIPGITIAQAVAGECAGLDGKDDGIPAFGKSKILCRIQLTGCDLHTTTVNTRHSNAKWESIMRCKLAKEVGKRVNAYIEKEGLRGTFPSNKIYLTRLVQASKGSWQPELWCEGRNTPNVDG